MKRKKINNQKKYEESNAAWTFKLIASASAWFAF